MRYEIVELWTFVVVDNRELKKVLWSDEVELDLLNIVLGAVELELVKKIGVVVTIKVGLFAHDANMNAFL